MKEVMLHFLAERDCVALSALSVDWGSLGTAFICSFENRPCDVYSTLDI